MKGRRHHRVPLSTAAVAVLDSIQQKRHNSDDYVFHSNIPGHKALGRNALLNTIQGLVAEVNEKHGLDISSDITAHGFRSSFADWVSERTSFPDRVREAALAHLGGGKTTRAYARSDLLEERVRLMQAWADFSYGAEAAGEVVPMRKARS